MRQSIGAGRSVIAVMAERCVLARRSIGAGRNVVVVRAEAERYVHARRCEVDSARRRCEGGIDDVEKGGFSEATLRRGFSEVTLRRGFSEAPLRRGD